MVSSFESVPSFVYVSVRVLDECIHQYISSNLGDYNIRAKLMI